LAVENPVTEADNLKPALLIIDVLIDFLASWPEADRAELVDGPLI
jgi:hypothetical protein